MYGYSILYILPFKANLGSKICDFIYLFDFFGINRIMQNNSIHFLR